MDWTFAYVLGGVALNALLLGFWKPWAAAYTGEKGKNFARKEDLDAILVEVRAVTITQKEIESKLSGELWNRQMHWNQKRDLYGELIKTCRNLTRYYTEISVNLSLSTTQDVEVYQKAIAAQSALGGLIALAYIFGNTKCQRALYKHAQGRASAPRTAEEMSQYVLETNTLTAELILAAKDDLGLPNS